MTAQRSDRALTRAREAYVAQWGALGSAWGIGRTTSRIHALLMVSREPLNTDQVMEELQISRGNAHGSLKELVGWGLVRRVLRKGTRKELFEAEKDVWTVVRQIVRERKRKELEPVLTTLDRCLADTKGLSGPEARAFRRQLSELRKFARLGDRAMEKVARGDADAILPWVLRFLK